MTKSTPILKKTQKNNKILQSISSFFPQLSPRHCCRDVVLLLCFQLCIHLPIVPTEGLLIARACTSCPAICGLRLATKEQRKNIALACLITPLHEFLCDANQQEKSMSAGAAPVKPILSLGRLPAVTKSRCWIFELNSMLLDMKHVLIALAK